uniref:Transposase (putative) YhgA-like domain-containing protein n=1 Tax=Candidatus Kentrum sp. LFY TaxID=2126342 RepID=A0A450UCA9_9GAMM|nr:MAG: protein of unknown function (DUF4351) [Candidatus Kentron sp. LFY]
MGLQKNPKWERLPAIVPLVFYHGATKWKIPNELLYLVDAEEGWRPYLLDFQFSVLDLGMIPDPELSEDRCLRARLLAMKYATKKAEQLAIRGRLIDVLKGAPEDLLPIVHYLISVYIYDEQTLREIIRAVRPEEEQKMMSQFAQDIRQKALHEGIQQGRREGLLEGEAKGKAKGEAKGEAKLLLGLLSHRFQPLPDEVSEQVRAANPSDIETWAKRVLDAKSLGDVFSE